MYNEPFLWCGCMGMLRKLLFSKIVTFSIFIKNDNFLVLLDDLKIALESYGPWLICNKIKGGKEEEKGGREGERERGKFMQNGNIAYLHGYLKRTSKTRFHDIFSCRDHFNKYMIFTASWQT